MWGKYESMFFFQQHSMINCKIQGWKWYCSDALTLSSTGGCDSREFWGKRICWGFWRNFFLSMMVSYSCALYFILTKSCLKWWDFSFRGFLLFLYVVCVTLLPSFPSPNLSFHKGNKWKFYCKGFVDISIQTQEKCTQLKRMVSLGTVGISVIFFIL